MGQMGNQNTIKGKLKKSFKSMASLTRIIGLIGVLFLVLTNFCFGIVMDKYGLVLGDIGKFETELEKSKYYLSELITMTNNDGRQYYISKLDGSSSVIEELLPKIEASALKDDEKQSLDEALKDKESYENNIKRIIDLVSSSKGVEAKSVLDREQITIINNMDKGINEYMEIKIDRAEKASKISKGVCIAQIILTILIILIADMRSKKISEKYSKEIGEPIAEVAKLADEIANGNLDVNISIDSDDEIGQLAKAFELMIFTLKTYINDISNALENMAKKNLNINIEEEYKGDFIKIKESLNIILKSLNEVFIQIKTASNEVSGGAEQVSSTAQVTSQGATNQAAQIEELLASIQEINSIVHNNKENAESTNEIYKNIVEDVQSENSHILEIVKAMEEIRRSSDDIKGIIDVIKEISSQTDLLALNAAIEAARVGEAGKGFAVVADEIRELSNQSSAAVNKTQELIEKAISVSEKGKELVDSTAESLLGVISKIQKSSGLINGIAEESEVQASKIEEINNVILQVSDVVSSNSSVAQESAAASEELTAQAETLDTLVSTFKLK